MESMRHVRGFTLVELMVTIVVLAILVTAAFPSFIDLIRNNRLTTQANDFVASLRFARAEAVKRGVNVNVAALAPAADGTDEWGGGWQIVDAPSGEVLRRHVALDSDNTLNSAGNISTYQFRPDGGVASGDTLELCDSRRENGRGITITRVGRVAISDPTAACD